MCFLNVLGWKNSARELLRADVGLVAFSALDRSQRGSNPIRFSFTGDRLQEDGVSAAVRKGFR